MDQATDQPGHSIPTTTGTSEPQSSSAAWSYDFAHVLADELDTIGASPYDPACQQTPGTPKPLDEVVQRAHNSQLTGLAFSGGGIRSATFNLGVLQGLADMKLLQKFQYLSTVSGGGYIGSWLTAWLHRRGFDEVEKRLRSDWRQQPGRTEPSESHFLRRYSNYLTPQLGWFGADTWTAIATYLRNLTLNLIILVAIFVALLLIPRGFVWLASVARGENAAWSLVFMILMGLSLLCGGVFIVANLAFLTRKPTTADPEPEYANLLDANCRTTWHTPTGETAELSLQDDILTLEPEQPLLYEKPLQSFILRTKFRLAAPHACADILIKATGDEDAPDEPAMEYAIRIADHQKMDQDAMGTIVGLQAPTASVLRTGGTWNDLEVRCVRHIYTVRLNDRTINTFHGRRHAHRQIGLRQHSEADTVQIRDVQLRELPVPPPWYTQRSGIQLLVVLPLFLAAFLGTVLLGSKDDTFVWWWGGLGAIGAVVTIYILGTLLLRSTWFLRLIGLTATTRPPTAPKENAKTQRACWTALWLTLTGALGGVLLSGLDRFITGLFHGEVVAWGPPLGIGIVLLLLTVFIGLMGELYPDQIHEWWSRLGAWLLIPSLAWIGIFCVALYSPPVLDWLAAVATSAVAALGLGWVASTLGGIVAARSPSSGQHDAKPWVEMLAKIAPYIFIIGLVAGLAWGLAAMLPAESSPQVSTAARAVTTQPRSLTIRVVLPEAGTASEAQELPVSVRVAPADATRQTPALATYVSAHWRRMQAQNQALLWFLPAPLLFFLVAGFVAWLFSWRLDINRFSMHQFYRNRLARCYLGASNDMPRTPQPFTGFDPNDDVKLADIARRKPLQPYPIINTALNLVGGSELAWQQRKAASFVFTPLYCGYDFPELPPGFCQTAQYACQPLSVTLATAMSISGAAASPNMGYHSSPATTFLMTVFNVRLGWWLGNPRNRTGWQRSSPTHVILHLMREMFGLTDEKGRFIYLSDGGHFENLGIYELVRRRCRFIVACDAEQDQSFEFSGLGNAIEKCRADLGVDIEIDVEPIRQRNASGHSQWHCAIGTIRYDRVDANAPAGTLVYIKASLTGDEPTDVLRYAAQHKEFPHQSTADQWFDESQFESYRALGQHTVTSVFGAVDSLDKLRGRTSERLFVDLRQRWFPPRQVSADAAKHTATLEALYNTLRRTPALHFLSSQIYPEWRALLHNVQPPPRLPRLPETANEIHHGFYLCDAMTSLMEDVYLDLRLEQEYDHPDNRGWMNLFRHWSWAPTFRVAWTINAANHGARFQSFCERHLDLRLGTITVHTPALRLADLEAGTAPASALNDLEHQLLGCFFRHYRDLRDQAQIFLLQMTSEGEVSGTSGAPAFTFGFAVVHRSGDTGSHLVYFRIQDHLRTMGLGRRALIGLIEQEHRVGRTLDLDLKEMPLDAAEIPSPADQEAFTLMFRAVRLEFDRRRCNTFTVCRHLDVGIGWLRSEVTKANLPAWLPEEISLHTGNFGRELSPDESELTFTWRSREATDSSGTLRVEGDDSQTKISVTHNMIPNEELNKRYRRAWLRCFDRLTWRLRDG
jgi:hypothetical protein